MREPTNKSHSSKLLVLLPSFIESIKQYENLKYLAKTNEVFNFAQLYRNKLALLQEKFDPREVAEKWPSFQSAKSCCSAIKRSKKTKKINLNSTSELILPNELQIIRIYNRDEIFLRYDNYENLINYNYSILYLTLTGNIFEK